MCDIVQQTPELQGIDVVQNTHKKDMTVNPTEKFSAVLKKLLSNAIRNSVKDPSGRRHDIVIKKFAVSFFVLSGPTAYNFFARIYQKLCLV